jgi:alpha-beta hydrolase superfamily lysophospholipase
VYTLHSRFRDTTFFDEDIKASIAIFHGFGENSDIFMETALQFAMNGLDVHLIDLRGFGFSGGNRCGGNKI